MADVGHRKHRFRWTGELVDLLDVDKPTATVTAQGTHDPRCTVLATVRRENGSVTRVPYTTLTPVTPPRFSRPPMPAGTRQRVPSF
jgi:hypothetical protein